MIKNTVRWLKTWQFEAPGGELITRDPVFQVNACLWLVAKPSPAKDGQRPYYDLGYRLRSLGAPLAFKDELRPKLAKSSLGAKPPEPDVLIHHIASGDHLVIECKASSFSSSSSTAGQARKLLIACADADSAVGVAGEAFVIYVIPGEDCQLQMTTLAELTAELNSEEFVTAPYGTLGLQVDDEGLWADLSINKQSTKEHVADVIGRVLVVPQSGGDFRPLYFIPYDPAAADNQDAEELNYCHKLLVERFYVGAVQEIGTADVPECLVIRADDLLRKATYGISDKWVARELVTLKARLIQGMGKILNKKSLKGKVEATGSRVEIRLGSEDDRQAAIDLLLKANTEQLALNNASPQTEIDTPK
ncbi:hypothetical protein ACFYXJ_29225 [Streptomyces sp. NPDC002667]|uniref:hypothetical protein n=1 Tax=Streptomyces sp. NPDC002667 TaxID=3364657 RepID=UPI00367EE4E8